MAIPQVLTYQNVRSYSPQLTIIAGTATFPSASAGANFPSYNPTGSIPGIIEMHASGAAGYFSGTFSPFPSSTKFFTNAEVIDNGAIDSGHRIQFLRVSPVSGTFVFRMVLSGSATFPQAQNLTGSFAMGFFASGA